MQDSSGRSCRTSSGQERSRTACTTRLPFLLTGRLDLDLVWSGALRSEAGADDGIASFSPVLDGVEDHPRRRRRFSATFIPPGLRPPLSVADLASDRSTHLSIPGLELLARRAPTICREACHANYSAWSGKSQRQTGLARWVASCWLPVRFFVSPSPAVPTRRL